MIPAKFLRPISSIIIMVYFSSCATTYEITRRSELDIPDDLGELTVQTTDGKEYTLEHYSFRDSTLTGIGLVEKDSLKKSFTGKLNLSEIQQIQATHKSWGKSILLIGVGTALLVTFLVFWNKQEDGLKNEVVIKSPGGCPNPMVSNNLYLENKNRLSAAGLKDMIEKASPFSGKVKYLDIMKGSDTFHLKVVDDVNQMKIEMVDDYPADVDKSNVLKIELSK